MAETIPTGAEPKPSVSTTGPAATATPAQAQPADTTDYRALYEREANRARGLQPFVEKARQVGFEKPEAFDDYGAFVKALQKRGLTLQQARALFEAGGDQNPEPQTGGDDELRREVEDLRQWREKYEREAEEAAFNAFDREEKAEREALEAQVRAIYGDDDPHTPAYLAKAREEWAEARKTLFFEDGHRLAKYRNKTLGEEGLKRIVKAHEEAVAKRKAGEFLDKGKPTAAPKPSTPGGNTTGQGSKDKASERKSVDDEFGEAFDRAMSGQRSR